MAKGLTSRQESIFEFILEYIQEEGYPPSIREIGQRFGIGSLRGVTVHLDALTKKGYIERNNTPRSIKVIHPSAMQAARATLLPLLGQIAAGAPIFSDDHSEEMIPVPGDMVKNVRNAFLLRVKGDSMSGDGIKPRDLVIIKPQQTANHNDLVAVQIDDEATVKRIHFDGPQIRLMPSNPDYEPIVVNANEARVIGKVIGLLRDYEGMAF
jgi:repressor LexA